MTKDQANAIKKIPSCVELDEIDGTWEHYVYRVEHPVCLRTEGENTYTRREAIACQKWLRKYAPESEYAQVVL